MKNLTGILLIVALLAIFSLGLLAANYSPGNIAVNGKVGLQVHDPRIDAQAVAIEQQARDAAAQAAIERQAQQAKVRQAQVEAEATEAAREALILRNRVYAFALACGAVIVVIGGAGALVTWAQKRAGAIYPNASGQYPVVVTRGFGWEALHDPNRGLGPSAIYRTPTLLDQAAEIILAIQQQRAPVLPQPDAAFPAPADTGTMLQIATQAQANQVAAAQNRWPKLPNVVAARVSLGERGARLVESALPDPPESRMPQITVIDDPSRVADMRQQLLECGR